LFVVSLDNGGKGTHGLVDQFRLVRYILTAAFNNRPRQRATKRAYRRQIYNLPWTATTAASLFCGYT
jgi:hypothetical protein